MIKRLLIFQIILMAGLGIIYALPATPPIKNAALITELPNFLTLSGWRGGPPGVPSEEEKEILSKDTGFFRRHYYREVPMSEQPPGRWDPELLDVLHASIVLSGKNLSGSIHALERCLGAQGFNIPRASTMRIKLRTGQTLAVRRLLCEKAIPNTRHVARSIAYYWFVGCDFVTSNHIRRGIKDFMDRILHGYDQRWAYVTVTAYLDPGQAESKDGKAMRQRGLTEADADRMVEEFIGDLGPDIIEIDKIKEWPKE